MTSNTGQILVFPRIQSFGSVDFPSRGKVYSGHATDSVHYENSSVSFVMMYCQTSTVFRNPASVQILINWSGWESLSTRSLCFGNRSSCAGSSVKSVGVMINKLAGSNNGSDCPATTGLPVLLWQIPYSSQKSEAAPSILSWLTEMIVRKTVSIVSPSAQKCIDNFPPPLLLSVPRDSGLVARKTGCRLSLNLIIINSATLSHSPRGLSM